MLANGENYLPAVYDYLADHRDTHWVDTYLNIMKHLNQSAEEVRKNR